MTHSLRRQIFTMLILFCLVSPCFSQAHFNAINETESLESVRAERRIHPLFLGISYEHMFPLTLGIHFGPGIVYDADAQTRIPAQAPKALGVSSLLFSPSVIAGLEFPYLFGVHIPLSLDIYTKIGAMVMSLGGKYNDTNDFLGYQSIDLTMDINVRFSYILSRYSSFGVYLASGFGLSVPLLRGLGYFDSNFSFKLQDENYSEFIDKSDPRLSENLNPYLSISTGITMNEINSRNIKIIFGYVFRVYFIEEFTENILLSFTDKNLGHVEITGLSLFNGLQLEFVYTIF